MSLPRPPRAVIFDLDGLLIDSETMVFEAMRAAAPAFGVVVDLAFFQTLVGLPRPANEVQLRAQFGADFPIEDFYAAASLQRNLGAEQGAALKAGVHELLNVLDARGLKRALCTSSGPDWVRRHFELHALTDRFNAIIARGDYRHGKPSPEPYLAAAGKLNVDPMECLALEDSHNGVRAAHAAGMMTIMVPDMLEATDEMRTKTVRIVGTLRDVAVLLSSAPRADGS
jgi:HAD superfamily hydrolase (TIGR01509 family)